MPVWLRVPHAWKGGLVSNGAGGALVQYGMFRDASKKLIPGVVYASNLSDGVLVLPLSLSYLLFLSYSLSHSHSPRSF